LKEVISLNKIDTELCDFLDFFSNKTGNEAYECMKQYKSKYGKVRFESKIIEYAVLNKYILIGDNKISNESYVITEKGLEILRNLKTIKFNFKSFWVSIGLSILAVIISIISLIK